MASNPTQTVYLVSGANRGIGFGLVETLAKRPHATVFAGARDPSKAAELRKLTQQHGNVHVLKLTSGSVEDNQAAAATIAKQAGKLDVVIANAGIANYYGAATSTPIDQVREHFEVNTVGPLVLFQAVNDLMQKSDHPQFVVLSSGVGSIKLCDTYPLKTTAYGASKAASNYIVRKIHFENEKLIAYPISPGWVATDQGNMGAKAHGMEQAPVTIADSVNGLLKVIDQAKRDSHSGKFWSFDGDELAW